MFTIKKDSWHYKVANRYRDSWDTLDKYDNVTFCRYFSNVMWSLFGTTIISAAFAWLAVGNVLAFSLMVDGLWLQLLNGDFAWPGVAFYSLIMGSGMVGCFILLAKLEKLKKKRDEERRLKYTNELLNPPEPREPEPPGFFQMWLTSIKEKVCVMVNFK